MNVKIGEKFGVLRLSVHVQPRAAANQITGCYDGALKVRLTAPPLEDRANRQLIQFLARCLDLPSGSFSLVKGQRSRRKTLSIQGLSKTELSLRIAPYLV
ncbi:MAG: DUF167 domain-containing protein [Acidobacteria bacterium]|nr:DUF167 domain-containing protein [Acidobacteriota bacterium]